MSAGIAAFFGTADNAGEQDLVSVSFYDESEVDTLFVDGTDEKVANSWSKNVLGIHRMSKGDVAQVSTMVRYNMINPVAIEKFDTLAEARTRAEALISQAPLKAKDYKGTP